MMQSIFKFNESQTKWSAAHGNSDASCLRFSPDGRMIAIGCFNGSLYLRNASRSRIIAQSAGVVDSPLTSLKFNPTHTDHLVTAHAHGELICWSATKEGLKQSWKIDQVDNSVNSIDISPDGKEIAAVGSDCSLKLYDYETQKTTSDLRTRAYIQGKVSGHTNRLFSCLYVDNNTIASCGWDDTVILWDMRSGQVLRSLFGAHICGEALAYVGNNMIVTGSWRDKNQLQFWDVGSANCVKSVSIGTPPNSMFIYTLSATPNNQFVACGGSKTNRVSVFRVEDFAHVAQTVSQRDCINTCHFSQRQFAYGMADSTIHVDNYSTQ